MTVNKKVTIRATSRRTGLTFKQSWQAVSALIELWSEALGSGERIAIDNFLVLEVKEIGRQRAAQLLRDGKLVPALLYNTNYLCGRRKL